MITFFSKLNANKNYIRNISACQLFYTFCHLGFKSAIIYWDLKFKSALLPLKSYQKQKGQWLWHKSIKGLGIVTVD